MENKTGNIKIKQKVALAFSTIFCFNKSIFFFKEQMNEVGVFC